jgi:hypothetical protein
MTRALLWWSALWLLAVPGASAQDIFRGRVEVGGGVVWTGSAPAGSSNATETTPSGGSSTIFNTSSTLTAVPGVRVHAAVRMTRSVDLEALAAYGKPKLETSVSGDIEGASAVTASETITEYVIGGGVVWYLPLVRSAEDRLRPFVAGSVSYLRQLHEDATLAVTGESYRAGGGVKYLVPVRRKSWLKAYGFRAEAGIAARHKGVFFDPATRFSPTVEASLVVRF